MFEEKKSNPMFQKKGKMKNPAESGVS